MQEYRQKLIDIREKILDYIRDENNYEDRITEINDFLDQNITKTNRSELNDFLHLIHQLSNKHQRSPDFFSKIERMIIHFKNDIKQTFSNTEIFRTFENNKRLLLFLIKENIIVVDKYIAEVMTKDKYKKLNYPSYFYPELKPFLTDESIIDKEAKEMYDNELQEFEENRQVGENSTYICKLIRNDEIDDFVAYMNRKILQPSIIINQSIFETNSYLLKHETSLIEYAAFFGAVQVFNHLYLIGAEVDSNLWFYVIHSRNPILIHSLEEKLIKPKNEYYRECVIESIICNHNEIAEYIQDVYIQQHLEIDFYIISKSIQYHNYFYFPEDLNKEYLFWKFIEYDYESFVNLFLCNEDININAKVSIYTFFMSFSFILFNSDIFFQIISFDIDPLILATMKGHTEIVKTLLYRPEIVISIDKISHNYLNRKNALEAAVEKEYYDIVDLLIKKTNLNANKIII